MNSLIPILNDYNEAKLICFIERIGYSEVILEENDC